MSETPAPTDDPPRKARAWQVALVAVGVVAFVLYTFHFGRGEREFWFADTLQGVLTRGDVDTLASGFVTNFDVELVTPEGTRTYGPADHERLRADVHALLDPLVGRDSMGRVSVDGADDEVAHAHADFGDTRVRLTLAPTDDGHAIERLEVGPRP